MTLLRAVEILSAFGTARAKIIFSPRPRGIPPRASEILYIWGIACKITLRQTQVEYFCAPAKYFGNWKAAHQPPLPPPTANQTTTFARHRNAFYILLECGRDVALPASARYTRAIGILFYAKYTEFAKEIDAAGGL